MRQLSAPLTLAVLVAVVAGAGCGDDESGDAIPKAEWVERADAICRETEDEIADLELPSADPAASELSEEDLAELSIYLEEVAQISNDGDDRLADLPEPATDAAAARSVLDLRGQGIELVEQAAAAAEDGDAQEYRAAFVEATTVLAESGKAAAELGLTDCAG